MSIAEALFFPYTDIDGVSLARVLGFFERIILYKPPLDQPSEELSAFEEKGLAIFHKASFFDDEVELGNIMSEFDKMADVYRDPGSLSLLMHYAREDSDEKSGARLMSSIRHHDKAKALERDLRREAQVFLTFIGKLDRQRSEVDDILSDVILREDDLSDIMGVEKDPDAPDTGPAIQTSSEVGLEMMPQRLAAWAHFYLADERGAVPLLTDRVEALSALDVNLAKKLPSPDLPEKRTMDILEPFIEVKIARNLDSDWDKPAQAPEAWLEFLSRIASRSWKKSELEELRKEAGEFAAAFNNSAETEPLETATLTGYLLPGTDLKQSFAVAAGVESADLENDLFCGPLFLIQGS